MVDICKKSLTDTACHPPPRGGGGQGSPSPLLQVCEGGGVEFQSTEDSGRNRSSGG
jgi:hypothetical protein